MTHGREICTQRSHTHRCCTPAPTTTTTTASAPEWQGWNVLFRQFRDELDMLRHQVGSPGGPTELALTVIAEAVAIAEALTVGAAPAPSGDQDHDGVDRFDRDRHALFDGVDCRYLDHRARALRAALHFVDDYVWWGGLRARAASDRLP